MCYQRFVHQQIRTVDAINRKSMSLKLLALLLLYIQLADEVRDVSLYSCVRTVLNAGKILVPCP